MKTTLMVSMIALAATMVSLSGCKDDDDKKPSNNFTVDGSKKAVKTALFLYNTEESDNWNTGEVYYRHQLNLLSDGFTIDGSTIEGKGNALILWIDGATSALDEGTYMFEGAEGEAGPFQIWMAYAFLDFTVGQSGGERLEFKSGELTVSKSDDLYTIRIEGMASGKAITAAYTGPVIFTRNDN